MLSPGLDADDTAEKRKEKKEKKREKNETRVPLAQYHGVRQIKTQE